MLLKTFPRTWQAAVALVVMLAALQQAFIGLQVLVVPDMSLGVWGAIKLAGSLLIGVTAMVVFYHYQSIAASKTAGVAHPLEVLNKGYETQLKDVALHHSATSVFSSRGGEIKPPEDSNEKPK